MFSPKSSEDTADLIEGIVLAHTDNALGVQQIKKIIEHSTNVSETDFNWALGRLKRRQTLLKSNYPLDILDSAVRRRSNWQFSTYSLLLGLSGNSILADFELGKLIPNGEIIFEHVSESSIRNWLGEGSSSVRFGWPSEVGRPPEFPDAIKWLSEKIGVELGSAYLPPIRKDGGVDVVVWKHFVDQREGFPILLVQCTLQEDLMANSKDIDVRNWSSWLTLDTDPWTLVATPRLVVEGTDKWKQITRKSIIFDRIRLSFFLGTYESLKLSPEIAVHLQSQYSALRESLEI